MLIKRDKSEELEKILAGKDIDEQAKNILQGILYKIEASYKDYKQVKNKKQTEEKYVEELIQNINKRCDKITIVKPSKKLVDEEIQKELDKNKFYVGEEIVSYPIEEKILYAIENKSRYSKILNNKYEEATIAISDLINTGKNLDRTEVIRDFNGWSWTTIKKEIQNIEANLIYQMLQIILGEEFVENWSQDKDGIIDYLEQFTQETTQKYGEKIAESQKELLTKIAIGNTIKHNQQFEQNIKSKMEQLEENLENYQDTQKKISQIFDDKKQFLKELNEIEKILEQEEKIKAEYENINKNSEKSKKIFNIKAFKKQLEDQRNQIREKIEQNNKLLNPTNYIEEKNKLTEKIEELQNLLFLQEQTETLLIKFIENFLKCFKILIKTTNDEEELIELIYKFRYFMLLPFNLKISIKDLETLEKSIIDTENKLVQKAIQKKVIGNVPFEIMRHVFNTRIIKLEDLYYKITRKDEKYYVQIFDDNVSEEKFEIQLEEKKKINKKIRIFI